MSSSDDAVRVTLLSLTPRPVVAQRAEVEPVSVPEALGMADAIQRAAQTWRSRPGAMRRLVYGLDVLACALGGSGLYRWTEAPLPANPSEAAEYLGRVEATADKIARAAASKTETAERGIVRNAARVCAGALQDFDAPPPVSAVAEGA